jgi:hypothetical protein
MFSSVYSVELQKALTVYPVDFANTSGIAYNRCVPLLLQIGRGGAEDGDRILFPGSGGNLAGNSRSWCFSEGHLHQLPNRVRKDPCLRLAHRANALCSESKVPACSGRATYTRFGVAGLCGFFVPCGNLRLIALVVCQRSIHFILTCGTVFCSFRLKRFLMLLLLLWDCR